MYHINNTASLFKPQRPLALSFKYRLHQIVNLILLCSESNFRLHHTVNLILLCRLHTVNLILLCRLHHTVNLILLCRVHQRVNQILLCNKTCANILVQPSA